MSVPSARRHPLVGLVTDNLELKASALVLSLVLFSLVHSDVDAQRSLFVDVVALLPPPGAEKMLVSELPHQVKVTLRGSRSRVSALSRDDLQPLQMDLTDTSRGDYFFDPTELNLGAGLQILEVSPARVQLDWAVSVDKRLPVLIRTTGATKEGQRVREPVEVRPDRVLVRGPADVVATLTDVEPDPLRIDGLPLGTHTRFLSLRALPEYVTYVEDVTVEARVVIEPVVTERTLRGLEVAVVGEGDPIVRPSRISVTLRGPASELEQLAQEDIVPYVEFSGAGGAGGTQAQEIRLRGVPDGIEVAGISPESVLVKRR